MGSICRRRFKRDIKMLICGLEGSGKTKLLYQLKYNKNVLTIPTLGFNVEILDIDDAHFLTFDLGRFDTGSKKEFYEDTDIILFVVDSADENRFYEAKLGLYALMYEKELEKAHLIVIANKQDLKEAVPTKVLVERLGLMKISQNWCMFSAVANYTKDKNRSDSITPEDQLIIDIKNHLLSYCLDAFYYNKTNDSDEGDNRNIDEKEKLGGDNDDVRLKDNFVRHVDLDEDSKNDNDDNQDKDNDSIVIRNNDGRSKYFNNNEDNDDNDENDENNDIDGKQDNDGKYNDDGKEAEKKAKKNNKVNKKGQIDMGEDDDQEEDSDTEEKYDKDNKDNKKSEKRKSNIEAHLVNHDKRNKKRKTDK